MGGQQHLGGKRAGSSPREAPVTASPLPPSLIDTGIDGHNCLIKGSAGKPRGPVSICCRSPCCLSRPSPSTGPTILRSAGSISARLPGPTPPAQSVVRIWALVSVFRSLSTSLPLSQVSVPPSVSASSPEALSPPLPLSLWSLSFWRCSCLSPSGLRLALGGPVSASPFPSLLCCVFCLSLCLSPRLHPPLWVCLSAPVSPHRSTCPPLPLPAACSGSGAQMAGRSHHSASKCRTVAASGTSHRPRGPWACWAAGSHLPGVLGTPTQPYGALSSQVLAQTPPWSRCGATTEWGTPCH